jgi:hypothetical protein
MGGLLLRWILEREVGGGIEWIDLAKDRYLLGLLVNTVMDLWVP